MYCRLAVRGNINYIAQASEILPNHTQLDTFCSTHKIYTYHNINHILNNHHHVNTINQQQ